MSGAPRLVMAALWRLGWRQARRWARHWSQPQMDHRGAGAGQCTTTVLPVATMVRDTPMAASPPLRAPTLGRDAAAAAQPDVPVVISSQKTSDLGASVQLMPMAGGGVRVHWCLGAATRPAAAVGAGGVPGSSAWALQLCWMRADPDKGVQRWHQLVPVRATAGERVLAVPPDQAQVIAAVGQRQPAGFCPMACSEVVALGPSPMG
ncbi:MAG: hypothetical protein ACPGUV_13400 [Polyangiales bacterium]